jgi:hypothetical protein
VDGSQQQQASRPFLPLLFCRGLVLFFFADWGGLLTPTVARTRLIWLTLTGRANRSASWVWISWLVLCSLKVPRKRKWLAEPRRTTFPILFISITLKEHSTRERGGLPTGLFQKRAHLAPQFARVPMSAFLQRLLSTLTHPLPEPIGCRLADRKPSLLRCLVPGESLGHCFYYLYARYIQLACFRGRFSFLQNGGLPCSDHASLRASYSRTLRAEGSLFAINASGIR